MRLTTGLLSLEESVRRIFALISTQIEEATLVCSQGCRDGTRQRSTQNGAYEGGR